MSFFLRTADPIALHTDAAKAAARGDDAGALDLYLAAARAERANPMHALRAGDCLVRMRRAGEAVRIYREVAERFAADGRFLRAISVYRLVQRLSPGDAGAARRIAELRARRAARGLPAAAPAGPATRTVVPPEVAEMFPVVEIEVDEVEAPKTAPGGPGAKGDVAALEATVRDLLGELLRAQCELDALRARMSMETAALTAG